MSERELFLYDVRVRDRFLTEGVITKADVDRRLATLPDLADHCEEVNLEQPALSTEPDDSVMPAPVELRPSAERMPSPLGDSPVREVIPAIAESVPAAPVPDAVQSAAVPVPYEAPAHDPNAPASVPPPTAAVDADWGDS
jgi:hypothetical protein